MRTPKTATLILMTVLLSTPSRAAPPASPPSTDWDYPELVVSPRASERLEREARIEARSPFAALWQLGLPGAMTFTAGWLQLARTDIARDPGKGAAWTGIGVGGAWMAATVLLATRYKPYASGLGDAARMPKSSQREQLARERAAEEAIAGAASTGTALKWLSFLSNTGASMYLASNANSGSLSSAADLIAVAAAFSPLIFEPRWIRVRREQQDYKKRIFGPLASASLSTTWIRTSARASAPALALSWSF